MIKRFNLIVAIAITFTVILSGCDASSRTNAGGNYVRIGNPSGSITGTVLDSDGNPVAKAEVYVSGQKTNTDTGGVFLIRNVPAINTVGTNGDITGQPLTVTIIPPVPSIDPVPAATSPTVSYLSATSIVTPQSQISGGNATGGNAAGNVSVYVDGYIASTGVTILPILGSTIKGILRNTQTGELLSNKVVRLNMESINSAALATNAGVAADLASSNYQSLQYVVTTDSNAVFLFDNLPNEGVYSFTVDDFVVELLAGQTVRSVATNLAITNLGDVNAAPILSADAVAPIIDSVTGVVNPTGVVGLLNRGINGTGGIVINFNEKVIGNINTDTVLLWDSVNGYHSDTNSLSADGRNLTVSTSTAIPSTATVEIFLIKSDFTDQSANGLLNTGLNYSSIYTAPNGTEYIKLNLSMFEGGNTNSSNIMAVQKNSDTSGVDDYPELQQANVVFNDVIDGTAQIEQLNSAADDDLNGNDAAERLTALSQHFGGGVVVADTARVTMTPGNASYYTYDLLDELGGAAVGAVITWPNSVVVNANQIIPVDNAAFDVTISGVKPGYKVVLTPFDDFGHMGTASELVLADNVEPAITLQTSYGVIPKSNTSTLSFNFGDGGELSSIGNSVIGKPYLNITAQMLDNLDSNGNDLSTVGGGLNDNTLKHELYAFNTEVSPATVPRTNVVDTVRTYDANAYQSFINNLTRTIGISFSENIALVGSKTPVYTGTNAQLSGFIENNNVTQRDATALVNADIVQMNVSNILDLAKDNDSTLDFVNVISDSSGNVMSQQNNSQLVIRDAMPPMVVSSIYSGIDLKITFNESITPTVNDVITIGDISRAGVTTSFTLSQTVIDAHAASLNKAQLVIPANDINWMNASGIPNTPFSGYYADVTQQHSPWNYDDAGNGQLYNHFEIDTSSIRDVNGNNWAVQHAGVIAPLFAAKSLVAGGMPVDVQNSIASGGLRINVLQPYSNGSAFLTGDILTFTYRFTNPVDMKKTFIGAGADASTLTAQQVAANFASVSTIALQIDSLSAQTQTSAILSTDRKALTVKVQLAAPYTVTTGDKFGSLVPVFSDYDANQSALAASVSLTAP